LITFLKELKVKNAIPKIIGYNAPAAAPSGNYGAPQQG